ncbi:MAG: Mur ligase family protein [Clostridium sp.]|nr:Mur ligase family protein [Clostridium sp.]
MTCREAEEYILAIPRFSEKHTLKETGELLNRIIGGEAAGSGIKSRIVHIAGTNGKGSVCAYLRSILMESGYSVGMFTSPHLESMRERICIGNELISEEEFVAAFVKVKSLVAGDISHPSFFEFLFLMAMAFFKEKEPDYIILETGLGGRLDATNCIARPKLCVITEIGYDHMQYLGDTLPEIAAEKAGIIKKGVPVVLADKRKETTEVLTEYAKKAESPAIIIGKDNILNVNINHKSIDFSLHTGYYSYVGLALNTTAVYQIENASLAVAAAHALLEDGITPETIKKGLWKAHWPGRMEEILPGVYLDGAHNEDGVDAFLNSVKRGSCSGKRFLLFGALMDKRYEEMIRKIAESALFEEIAAAAVDADRSVSAKEQRRVWGKYKGISCTFYEDAKEAYLYLLSKKKDEDIVYTAGSLYLIGQIKSLQGE